MAYRDYGPGYRGRDDRDFERGRFSEREQDRYGGYGRERSDLPERDYRERWYGNQYNEDVGSRDFESGRWNRERDYGDIGRERGTGGTGFGGRGDVSYRDRYEGRGGYEGSRGFERRGEFEARGGFDRDNYDRERDIGERGFRGGGREGGIGDAGGMYDTSPGYGLNRASWGSRGSGFERSRGFVGMGPYEASTAYGGYSGISEPVGYGTTGIGGKPRVSHVGRGPKGYRRADTTIRDEINERLTRHPDIDASDIEVRVESSEVVLTGIVEDRRAKRLAEDIAEDVWGVDDVRNELKVRHGFLAKLTGEQADEREIARTTSRETAGTTGTESTRRTTGRTNPTATPGVGTGTGGTSGT